MGAIVADLVLPSEASVDVMSQPEVRLARLWERRAAFPGSFRGIAVEGVELISWTPTRPASSGVS